MSANTPTSANTSAVSTNRNKPVLDIKNTDIGAVMRQLATEYFKADTLAGVTELEGAIVRVIQDPKKFDFSPFNLINLTTDSNKVRYKVYVFDIHFMFDNEEQRQKQSDTKHYIPSDNTEYGRFIISSLPDFIVTNSDLSNLAVGDRVKVAFTDVKNFTGGIIKEKINATSNGEANVGASNGSNAIPPSAKNAFSGDNAAPTVTNISQEITEEDGYRYGKKLPQKLKLKPIIAYTNQRMRADAADKFNQMVNAAKGQGVRVIAVSGFRSHNEQIRIYNDRYQIKYPYDRNDPTKKPPSNSFIPPNNAAAAYPGYSNHQSGIAVDIDTIKISTPREQRYAVAEQNNTYRWLKEHASQFGFNNVEGTKVDEPWHWVYGESTVNESNIKDNKDV